MTDLTTLSRVWVVLIVIGLPSRSYPDTLPAGFLGWFVPTQQSCGSPNRIEVRPSEIRSADGVRRIVEVERSKDSPRLAHLVLQTSGGGGTIDVLVKLGPDGQDLRVIFGDGFSLVWRRCI
ncbi:MAG: hypothetical protein J0L76_13415 [Rhodobacterales bacterium]|nr:hypothetical protein [Rhodobacterales bacterium]